MVPDQTLAKYRGRDQFFGKASVGHHPNSPLAPTPTRAPLLRSCPSHARSRPWLGFRAGQGSVFAAGAAPVDSDGSSPSPPSPPRAVPLPAGHEGQPGRIGLGLLCFRSVMDEEPLGRKGVYQPRSGARCAWSAATTFGPTTHGHFRDKLLHQAKIAEFGFSFLSQDIRMAFAELCLANIRDTRVHKIQEDSVQRAHKDRSSKTRAKQSKHKRRNVCYIQSM
ncbi:uncharacterized protein [Triticum aestivum]|uniref:uncharacterized protein isoform X6 n=1 Tax=Triticum aestivum TaxID=4565 RepID=UPI001D00D902|nr:uncharacterized protein LOC123091650 isoform X6 [Triticum aestivum]XP_044369166.1 uncharacterized protein LOC123091650 isoform X6 [Triticum aestivum]